MVRWEQSAEERFLAKIGARSSDCWEWVGATQRGGYGEFSFGGRPVVATRWAYEHWIGPIGSMDVLHRCDNPPCVNPSHLFLGTAGDNLADAKAKGRLRLGEASPGSKLTAPQVAAIRAMPPERGVTRVLASRFGVTPQTIGKIRNGIIWRQEP